MEHLFYLFTGSVERAQGANTINRSASVVYNFSSLPLSFLSLYGSLNDLQKAFTAQQKKKKKTKQVVLALGQIAYPFKKSLICSDEVVMKGTDLSLRHTNLQEQRIP